MQRFLVSLFFLLTMVGGAYAQSSARKDLENRRNQLLKEISETQKLLDATQADRKATMGTLQALRTQLSTRQKLINTINTELGQITGSIQTSSHEIDVLSRKLDQLRKDYAQSVRYSYKNRESIKMMAFLFSAESVNDAFRRMQYLKRFREYRKVQVADIQKIQTDLQVKIKTLNDQKAQKGKLLNAEEQQKQHLVKETNETNQLANQLRGKEKDLVGQINRNKSAAKKLESAIKAQIQKEIELARKKAEEEARKRAAEEAARKKAEQEALARKKAEEEAARKREEQAKRDAANSTGGVTFNTGSNTDRPAGNVTRPAKSEPAATTPPPVEQPKKEAAKPSYKLSLTPEVQAISNNFASNRGALPWPVERGVISGHYGKHPHPLFPKVMLENNGIDITTESGARVRCVFDGIVMRITNIEGSTVVMINHGEYFTVYNNLSDVNVRVGDKVKTKQPIGKAARNEEGNYMVNFQVWKVGSNNSISTDNPSSWIAR